MTFQLHTLVLPSNVLAIDQVDSASSYIEFRAPGSDKVHSAIVSGQQGNHLNWGKPVVVHHTPDTIPDLVNVRRNMTTSYDQFDASLVDVRVGRKNYYNENIDDVLAAIGNMMTYGQTR